LGQVGEPLVVLPVLFPTPFLDFFATGGDHQVSKVGFQRGSSKVVVRIAFGYLRGSWGLKLWGKGRFSLGLEWELSIPTGGGVNWERGTKNLGGFLKLFWSFGEALWP